MNNTLAGKYSCKLYQRILETFLSCYVLMVKPPYRTTVTAEGLVT